jgi:hypothetical protein
MPNSNVVQYRSDPLKLDRFLIGVFRCNLPAG